MFHFSKQTWQVIITDSKEFAFNFPTRYRIDVSKKIDTRLEVSFHLLIEEKVAGLFCLFVQKYGQKSFSHAISTKTLGFFCWKIQ
jgi:hypothetical protein